MGYSGGTMGPRALKLSAPFCRQSELEEIKKQLLNDDCRAIFLGSEMGFGATTLLRELAKLASAHAPVFFVSGTPSLTNIPFGVLAPYLNGTDAAKVTSELATIRAILSIVDEREAAIRSSLPSGTKIGVPLLIIDEADHIDKATATVALRLVRAGSVKVVVSQRSANVLVEPLPRLWAEGLAERMQLQPLTREQAHTFCGATLGGRITASSSWYFWSVAAGNPMLMRLIMADAFAHGALAQRGEIWVVETNSPPRSQELKDAVGTLLRGLSNLARQTLNLVALAEPVSATLIGQTLGQDAVTELLNKHLVLESMSQPGELQLINPIFGEVIRTMVPRAESVMLHRQLMERRQLEELNPQALLRRVVWALDNGEVPAQEKLLEAGIYACKLFQSPVALRLGRMIDGDEFAFQGRCVQARAHYNMGDYQAAAELLDGASGRAENLRELMFGAFLHAATRAAVREAPELGAAHAQALRQGGARISAEDPEHAANILMQANERADVLDILTLSRMGSYHELGNLVEAVLVVAVRDEDPDYWINRAVVLAVEAERLSALGKPLQGMLRAGEALAIPQAEFHDVFFLPEMVLGRVETAALTAGAWGEVEAILDAVAVNLGPSVISFGGSSNVARGMMQLRQGLLGKAYETLADGIDSLRLSDPQQLLGYCTAMAFYAASALGKAEDARHLLAAYREGMGMFLVTTHERAFLAAGLGHLNGGGHGSLLDLADAAARAGQSAAELNALVLALDFGHGNLLPRVWRVAGSVEGSWAASIASFAQAMENGTGEEAVAAGELLMNAKLFGHAATAFQIGEQRSLQERNGAAAHSTRIGLARATTAMGIAPRPAGAETGNHTPAHDGLTKREREIAKMAACGLSDKEIASQLHVSVRTVEGHLYRSYAKLGITARVELSTVVFD